MPFALFTQTSFKSRHTIEFLIPLFDVEVWFFKRKSSEGVGAKKCVEFLCDEDLFLSN